MKTINPYLIFNGNAEEAFRFYQSVFGGDLEVVRFKDMPGTESMSDDDKNKLAHVALSLGRNGHILMASDATSDRKVEQVPNGNFYITLEPDSAEEAQSVFSTLSEGGHVIMPLDKTEWADLFAMFADKYGIQWMISYGD